MSFLAGLPADAALLQVFRAYPHAARLLLELHEVVKPVLRYVGKLTRTPAKMTAADAETVFAAGRNDDALHSATAVCALFNFTNRMVDGLGIQARPAYYATSGTRLHDLGYAGLAALLES